jgi:hypothetical protein
LLLRDADTFKTVNETWGHEKCEADTQRIARGRGTKAPNARHASV